MQLKPHIYEGFKVDSARLYFWISAQKWINETGAALLIGQWLPQEDRLIQLNQTAITQLTSLLNSQQIKKLMEKDQGGLQSFCVS